MERLLEIEGVSKIFGRLAALNEISFYVETGEILGIAGPNGAGKTTLYDVITGIPYGPDRGVIKLDGRPIMNRTPNAICKLGAMRTFQTEVAFNSLTVLDNVLVASHYVKGGGRAAVRQRTKEALQLVGLEGDSSRLAGELPVLGKKKLMIASALASDPRLLMLDEPASALNEEEQHELAGVIRRANAAGITIMVIEHVLPFLIGIVGRLMVLDNGSCLRIGQPDEVMADERVILAYAGQAVRLDD